MIERKKLSKETEMQIIKFSKENSLRKTADAFGIGVDKIRATFKKYGVSRTEEDRKKLISKSSTRKISEEEKQKIVTYYQTHSVDETAVKFNYSPDWIRHFLKHLGAIRHGEDKINFIAKKRKTNNLKNHPVDELEVIEYYQTHSDKDTRKKFHITYNRFQEIFTKHNIPLRTKDESNQLRVQTNLKKYGVEAPIQNSEVWEKKEKTTLEKYGVTNIGFLPEAIAKRKQTNLAKYGTETPSSTDEIKEKVAKTNLERYGVTSPMKDPRFRSTQAKNAISSKLEKRMEEFLINNGFEYEHHFTIKEKDLIHAFDFAIFKENKLEILIDCDGKYYHGYESDIDGKTVSLGADEYRQLLVPEGVKFLICLEKQEEEAQKELLSLYNISYDDYIKEIFDWCREVEFPYPEYNNKILNTSFKSLLKADINKFNMRARYGDKIINHFHPSIFKCNTGKYPSPYNAWSNDELLKKCIKNRIIYKGCNLDRSKVLAGLSIAKIAPKISIFNSYLAKYIIKKYLDDYNTIFDPFSGYSGRMLGACSLDKYYIGQDINPTTVAESNNIINYFGLNAQICVKDLLNDSGNYPCLFTCPPYGDKENWGQSVTIKNCDGWITECLNRYKCEKYVFVVDNTELYKDCIVEELTNKSHFGENKEYIVVIEGNKQ